MACGLLGARVCCRADRLLEVSFRSKLDPMRSPGCLLRTCRFGGALVVLGAIACASEPSPSTSDSSATVTGSTTHDASTSASVTTGASTSTSASTSVDSTTGDSTGTVGPDSADDLPVPDLGGPRPSCHPLEPLDCPEGQACYPIDGVWQCAPDASGDAGAYGDPCDSDDGCDPGLACLPTNALPPGLPCEGAAGCCTVLCDFSDPDASLGCPSAADGQLCLPWYPAGEAPPGYDDVGACSLWP